MAEYSDDERSNSGSDTETDREDHEFVKKPKLKILGGVDDSDDDSSIMTEDDEEIPDKTFETEDDYVPGKYDLHTLTEEDEEERKKKYPDYEESDYDSDMESDDDDANYLQKFSEDMKRNVIQNHHPELMMHNYQEVEAMCAIVRDENGEIVDPLHRTQPFITKFEKARVLGERAKQINAGAKPMVPVEDEIIDGYLIALREYEERKIPIILRRPLPNGGCEYWRLSDLELIV
jgi:DNA-directed RNA polymerase I, II, and III subunit RPABC2